MNLPKTLSTPLLRISLAALAGSAFGSAPAAPAIRTVGTGGAYATIQAALFDSLGNAGPDEIRIRPGIFQEHLDTGILTAGNDLDISGGWDATFTTRSVNPGSTVIDGDDVGRAMRVGDVYDATVIVRGLAFLNGRNDPLGGGMKVAVFGSGRVRIEKCLFQNNTAGSSDSTFGAAGGGLAAEAGESAAIEIVDSYFSNNSAALAPATGTARGGGLSIELTGQATAVVRRTAVSGSLLAGGSFQSGAGVYALTKDDSRLNVEDSWFYQNRGEAGAVGTAMALVATGNSAIDAQRMYADFNQEGSDGSTQVRLRALDTATLRFADTVVADGNRGIDVSTGGSGVAHLVNLTVLHHAGKGIKIVAAAPAAASLANSISWANAGGNLDASGGAVTQQANLLGIDPQMEDEAGGDYRLSLGSPALDTGIATPVGGLGSHDTEHRTRLVGTHPDRGAYERGGLFSDGFESDDTFWWTATP